MRDVEALQANTEALTALEKRMQVVQGIMDEVANELGWLARNIQDVARGDTEGPREEVRCMECDAEPVRGLAEALRIKWSCLMLHDGRFMGMCPNCAVDEARPADAAAADKTRLTAEKNATRSKTIVVDAEQFARAMESIDQLSYCCESPDLQWEGEPESPGIQCRHCGYIVAESGEIVDYRQPADGSASVDPSVPDGSNPSSAQRELF